MGLNGSNGLSGRVERLERQAFDRRVREIAARDGLDPAELVQTAADLGRRFDALRAEGLTERRIIERIAAEKGLDPARWTARAEEMGRELDR